MVLTEQITYSLDSLAGATGSISFTVPTGFTIVGIVGFSAQAWQVSIAELKLDENNASQVKYIIKNTTTERLDNRVLNVKVLCMKS